MQILVSYQLSEADADPGLAIHMQEAGPFWLQEQHVQGLCAAV